MSNNVHAIPGRSRLLDPVSVPRLFLAGLIDRKLGIANKRDLLVFAAANLRDTKNAAGDASAALNALDAQEVAEMTAWANSPSGPAPVGDAARREQLQRDVRIAAAQATAASKAEAGYAPNIQRENTALQQIEPQISAAITPIMIDDIEVLLTEFEILSKSLHTLASRIIAGKETVLRIAESGPFETMRPTYQALEQLTQRINAALQPPAPSGDGSEWPAYAGRLRSDPIARLED